MFTLNRATVLGNVTRDPELKTTPSGQSVLSMSVATSQRWKDKMTNEMRESSEFHDIVVWGKTAEWVGQFTKKGHKVYVEGRLQTRSWDKPDGSKAYKTEIVADEVIMLQPKMIQTTKAESAPLPEPEKINPSDIPF